jgi:hypothetical protein
VAAIEVATNGAPLPGTFSANPESGDELKTPFVLTASTWSDTDAPLQYQFAFQVSQNSDMLVVQTKSLLSFASSVLPASLEFNGFAITVSVGVFDSLNANTTTATRVTVSRVQRNATSLQS